ncbi:MAG: radical SAM protein [Vicinamibacterales bacterium]
MKLGLLALSGLRACDPELTAIGLTLPGFVERSEVIASLPSLGLLTLAGMTPDEIDLEYVDVPEVLPAPWLPREFDCVAISSFTAQIKDAYRLADRYRAAGTTVILGGTHVTALPNEAADHADAIVVGEGESVWPQVVGDLMRSHVRPVYDGRRVPFDLAKAPLPRYELLDIDKYNRLTVQTQRGCPFDCEFCAASIRVAPGFKVKPVAAVISEIQRIKSLWPRPFIEFADDNTFANKNHGRNLARAMLDQHVRWFTETDVSVADDPALLSMMCDSGCAQVLIGFETPNRAAMNGLELRSNWKARQVDRYLAAIERIQSFGITVNGCFVLGLDGTGPESFDEILRFIRESGMYEVQVTVQTAFPGTPLYDRLAREGRLIYEDAWERCTLFDVNFRPSGMTVAQLESGLRNLGGQLYSEQATRDRRRQFHERGLAARRHSLSAKGGHSHDT